VAHNARVWNYWLGGKDNYAADQEVGDQVSAMFPVIRDVALADRAFLGRAVTFLAGEAGIRQFLDIGTGLPTANNTHEVAQHVAPQSRIVYVDNDPLVLAHARVLLTSSPEGATDYVDASLYEPDRILAAAAQTLDLSRPTALILSGILGHVTDYDQARSLVRQLLDGLPSGSYLCVNDGSRGTDPAYEVAQDAYNETGAVPYFLRPVPKIEAFFEGLELVEPGVVSVPLWHPEKTGSGEPTPIGQHGGLGRKP
jgi:O-methyltransferase involved in polyketide biosynthesis